MKKKEFNIKKLIFKLSLIMSIIITIWSIGKRPVLPLPSYTNIINPSCSYKTDDERIAVIDNGGHRILITNSQEKITNIIYFNKNSLIDKATIIVGDEKYWYVAGVKYNNNARTINCERIIRYDKTWNVSNVVFEKYRTDDRMLDLIQQLDLYNENLYFTLFAKGDNYINNQNAYYMEAYRINIDSLVSQDAEFVARDTTPDLFVSNYIGFNNTFYNTDWDGTAALFKDGKSNEVSYYSNKIIRYISPYDNQHIFACDVHNNELYLNDEIIKNNISILYMCKTSSGMSCCIKDENAIGIYNINTKEFKQINHFNYSNLYMLILFIKLVFPLYIVVLLILLAIKKIKKITNNKWKELIIVFGSLLFIAITIILSSSTSYKYSIEDAKKDVKSQCDFFAKTYADNPTLITDYNDKDVLKKYDATDKYILSYIYSSGRKSVDYIVYLSQKIGDNYYRLYDSTYFSQTGTMQDKNSLLMLTDSKEALIMEDNGINTIRCGEKIYDANGNEIGIIEVGRVMDTFEEITLERSITSILNIISILGAIYLLIIEVNAFMIGKSKKEKADKLKNENSELYCIRSASFLTKLAIALDSVLLVLITRDMLFASGYTNDKIGMLMALPVALMGIGLTIGSVIYTILARNMTIRKFTIAGSILMIFSYILITYAVIKNNFIFFCIFKFVGSIANNIIYGTISSMPYQTKNEKMRYETFQNLSLGGLSSSILGVLVGGYIADKYGNVFVYVASVVILIIVLCLLCILLPRNTYYVTIGDNHKNLMKKYLHFFISKEVIAYLLFLSIPFQILYGYKNFLFPIYSSVMDMPKIYISSFVVIAKLITMFFSENIKKISIQYDYWNVVNIGMMGIGIFFLGFFINSTIVWAVIMLIVVSVFEKAIAPAKSMLIPRLAEDMKMDVTETGNVFYILEQFLASSKEYILSFFLLFGGNRACCIVGIFLILCISVFAIITKKSALAPINV